MTINAERNETQIAYHRRRWSELTPIRLPWEQEWSGIAEFVDPTRLRLTTRDERPVSRRSILDASGTLSFRTLKSGMHSGITSPARPWFRLRTKDPDLREFAPVKTYLNLVETKMRETFAASNIYTSFHTGYGDLALFGQPCGILVPDDDSVVRMHQLTPGTFWIARDDAGRLTTMYRRFRWSVQRIVGRFGYENCSRHIQSAYDRARYDQSHDIWHAIEPRLNRNPRSHARWDMPFLSNYWEDQGGDGKMLSEGGFETNPLVGPAWELSADDNYGCGPASVALGDVKMLQKEQARKLEGIDKLVRPPMVGPTSMRGKAASLLPGGITYVDAMNDRATFRPAMDVRLSLADLREDIREVQARLSRIFYEDLFLMLSNMDGIQPRNVMEIAERKEEKLLALGPVLENIYAGQLEPVIDRTYQLLNERGELPPPPMELQGDEDEPRELEIEYTSILAQAQKAVATGGIERGWAFAGQIAAVKPEVLDKLDEDETVDQYFEMLGVSSITRSDDEVARIREQRQQAQQAAQNAEMAATMAPAAKAGADAAAVLASAQDNPGGGDLLARIGIG